MVINYKAHSGALTSEWAFLFNVLVEIMVFEIYGTSESADVNPNRTWEWLGEVGTLSKAKQTAKRVSSMKMWHEVEVRGIEDGEQIHHSYWQGGKLAINMSV